MLMANDCDQLGMLTAWNHTNTRTLETLMEWIVREWVGLNPCRIYGQTEAEFWALLRPKRVYAVGATGCWGNTAVGYSAGHSFSASQNVFVGATGATGVIGGFYAMNVQSTQEVGMYEAWKRVISHLKHHRIDYELGRTFEALSHD